MVELKPCPFCGSAFVGKSYLSYAHDCTCIECNDCHARGKICGTLEEASPAWHTRVEPPELATLREQVKVLREALERITNKEPQYVHGFDDQCACPLCQARAALSQTKPKEGE